MILVIYIPMCDSSMRVVYYNRGTGSKNRGCIRFLWCKALLFAKVRCALVSVEAGVRRKVIEQGRSCNYYKSFNCFFDSCELIF